MHDADRIRDHIAAVSRQGPADALTHVERIQRACWPGGESDRTDPAARRWVERWRPARAGAALRMCSCAQGPCAVCN